MIWLAALACRTHLASSAPVPDVDPSAAWGDLLAEVVTEDGYVRYSVLAENRNPLDTYVAWLSRDDLIQGQEGDDDHALYLNAYNALVLFQVLERGRPASVMDVPGTLPRAGAGFFVETAFDVGEDWLSLAEIEHERIRMTEMDFRDHAAMNCASRSCPPLRRELYQRGGLQGQLKDQFKNWVADRERGMRIEADVLVVSQVFETYARDFTFWSGGKDLCTLAARYADPAFEAELTALAAKGCPQRAMPWDSALNDAP